MCATPVPRYLQEIRPTLALALPIIVGQVSQMLMGVTDSLMIGHVGTAELAAAAFGGNVFVIFYVLGVGLMVPVSVFVARARGAARPEEAGEYLRHGLGLALAFGLLELLVMLAVSTQLARFGQPPEVLAVVRPYFLLIAGSIVPVLVYLALRQFAEALGHPWLPMCIMLGGVGLNAVLNWLLIYGHGGLPAMGLTGAGLATLISRVLSAAVIFEWLRREARVRAAWPVRWWRGVSGARLMEMLHVGLPAGVMLLFEATAFAFSSIMIGWLGAVPLAAHQIAISCASLAFMFPLGLSMAAGMRVSQAVGAGERERLRPVAFGAMAVGLAIMAGFAGAFGLGGGRIATWFVHDTAVIALATQLLVVAAVFQLADGLQVIGAAVLRGMTDVRVPAVITLVAYWGIALPVGYTLGIRGPWGAVGVWIGIASGLGFAAVFLVTRFTRMTRR
ncbi:MATE family efflux transporter [Horticoccus luteus]|uniref:MATE family efflux transporter n=1 Tax=Horticoccus luteus TaxID=2862869 RepID=UPI00210598D0|nr:MATE family efflux transporter [Horticoccus luteus]